MRTSNAELLAEIDALEEVTRKDAKDLEVVKTVDRLEHHVDFLERQMDKHTVDVVAHFGGWLVNNHEHIFSGGEIEIAQLCSDFVEQLEAEE